MKENPTCLVAPTPRAGKSFPVLLLLALALGASSSVVSAAVVVTKDPAVPLLDDGYGYNTRFPDTAEPWQHNNNFWTLAFGDTWANCLRYPGGTVASFWNARGNILFSKKTSADPAGWVDTAKIGFEPVTDIILNNRQQINSLQDLKTVVNATGATVLFVMNLVTPGKDFYASPQGWNRPINDHPGIAYNAQDPDDWYKLLDARYERSKQMLIRANNNGIPVKRIELGNEYYLANCTYYKEAFPDDSSEPTAGKYMAIAANYIANKLLNDPDLSFLPSNVQISVPGAAEKIDFASTRILNWNAKLTAHLNSNLIKNISLHSYQEADTSITTFNATNVQTNVSTWLANMDQTLRDKSAYATILNDTTPFKVWWNELAPSQEPEGQSNPAKKQWGAALLRVFAGLWSADHKGAVFCHPNLDGPLVVNEQTGELNISGIAFQPLMRATKGCTKAFHLNFPGLPRMGTSLRTVLQGQYFENATGSVRKCCIISFASTPYTIDLTGVFSGVGTLTLSGQRNTGPEVTDNPIGMGDQSFPSNAVVIQPYSINFIRI